jgi:hypothetical protein
VSISGDKSLNRLLVDHGENQIDTEPHAGVIVQIAGIDQFLCPHVSNSPFRFYVPANSRCGAGVGRGSMTRDLQPKDITIPNLLGRRSNQPLKYPINHFFDEYAHHVGPLGSKCRSETFSLGQ